MLSTDRVLQLKENIVILEPEERKDKFIKYRQRIRGILGYFHLSRYTHATKHCSAIWEDGKSNLSGPRLLLSTLVIDPRMTATLI